MKKIIFTLSILLLSLSGCKELDFLKKDKKATANEIQGVVSLPEGSALSVNDLTVYSMTESNTIDKNGKYTIGVPKDVSTNFLFAGNSSEEVMMIGYALNNENTTIDAKSTVISLVMSLPFTAYLTEEAKEGLADNLTTSSGFQNMVRLTEELIKNGISPISEGQPEYQREFASFLVEVTSTNNVARNVRSTSDYSKQPVNFIKAGNQITFVNNGKLYGNVVGVYRNGTKVKNITLDRVEFFATSTSELFQTSNNLAAQNYESIEIVGETYEMKEDGEYKFVVDSGLGNLSSDEGITALGDNIANWSLDFLTIVIGQKNFKNQKAACIKDFIGAVSGIVQTSGEFKNRQINTVADGLGITYDITKQLLENTSGTLSCFVDDPISKIFANFVSDLFSFDKKISAFGTGLNGSVGVFQWVFDENRMEFCYQKQGDQVVDCDYDGLSEDIQKILPKEVLDSLESRGVVINRGDSPPLLNFAVKISPYQLQEPFGPNDQWQVGQVISDYYYKFYDQTGDGAIKTDYYNDGADRGKGLGSFISGEGNKFTIFSEDTGIAGDEEYKQLSVVSATAESNGLRNFQFAFVLTYKSKPQGESRLIPINTGRIWIDGDAFSEKYDAFQFPGGRVRQFINSQSAADLE